jgi:hypothetical protein
MDHSLHAGLATGTRPAPILRTQPYRYTGWSQDGRESVTSWGSRGPQARAALVSTLGERMRKLGWGLGWSRRMAIVTAATAVVVIAGVGAVGASAGDWFGNSHNPWPLPRPVAIRFWPRWATSPVSLGALRRARSLPTCAPVERATARNAAQNATAQQVEAMKPALVAVLGDEQYQNGYYSDFENSYDKYWGAFKFLQRPAPGNHEFYDNHGQTGVRGLGYFDYFNGIQHNAAGSELDETVTNPTTGTVVSQPVPEPQGQAGNFGQTETAGTPITWVLGT